MIVDDRMNYRPDNKLDQDINAYSKILHGFGQQTGGPLIREQSDTCRHEGCTAFRLTNVSLACVVSMARY